MHAVRRGAVHNECARAEKERERERGGGEEEEAREAGIRGSVNRGKDAPAVGWMLLFEFLSSKREPMEGTDAAELREHDVEIDNG